MDRVLQTPPRLATLYATALVRSARARLHRGHDVLGLPGAKHRLDDLSASPEKALEFQELMGRPQSEFLPSGYIHTLTFPVAVSVLARPDFPLPLLGMIHLRNEIHHLRPIALDERLSVTAWVENLLPHRSGTQVDVVVDVESASQHVWKGRSTYLAKGIHSAVTGSDSVADAAESGQETEEPPDYPTGEWSLAKGTGRRYAAVSGDYNPIHLGVLPARALGMKRPIAHGMYLASRMAAEAGPGEASPFRWSVEFRAPVSLPSRVFISADVARSSTAQWHGAQVTAWDPRRRRTHFSGRLESLDGDAGAE